MARVVWDIDGNEWSVVGETAYLALGLNGVKVPYDPSNFFDTKADFVRARIKYERDNDLPESAQ